jgi:lactoylglutathione lyase
MKINLVVVKTSRPHELASFYKQMGIKFESHRHGNGPIHYAAEIDSVVFEIYPLPRDREQANDTLRLGFTVDNLDEVIERLKNSAGKIIKEAVMTEWGYMAIIEDLDGRKIELKDRQKSGG